MAKKKSTAAEPECTDLSVVTPEGPSAGTGLIPSQHELSVYLTMAERAAESKLYRGIGDQSAIVMQMLAARELGISPCLAINGGLRIIQGNIEISARLMTALIRRAKHQLKVIESTDEICVIEGKRADTGEILRTSYSLEDARRAGLVKPGGGWMKFPKDMCFARAASRLARQLFSDVIGIGYVEGEISGSLPAAPTPAESTLPWERAEVIEPTPKTIPLDPVATFLEKVDQSETFLWVDYMNLVAGKFGWTIEETINKFNENFETTKVKFQSWREKQCSGK